MYFDNFSDFISMGGHATYVWSCYLITLVIVILNVIFPMRARKNFFTEQARRIRRENIKSEMNMKDEAQNASGS